MATRLDVLASPKNNSRLRVASPRHKPSRCSDRYGDHIAPFLLRLAFICGIRLRTSEDDMFNAALNSFTSIAARTVQA
jgi:hypothetical protein